MEGTGSLLALSTASLPALVGAGLRGSAPPVRSTDPHLPKNPTLLLCTDPHHLNHPALLLCTEANLPEKPILPLVPLVPVLVFVVVLLVSGCGLNPQETQIASLLDQLVVARGMFVERPPQVQAACDAVGDVQTRLNYEPGLSDIRPAWAALSDAAGALQAVCGQSALLGEPALDTPVLLGARERWQQSVQREIGVACDHLRDAASAVHRAPPC